MREVRNLAGWILLSAAFGVLLLENRLEAKK